MKHKEAILKLRQEGKTYDEIKAITGASKATISYHCGKGQKEKNYLRQKKRRGSNPIRKKAEIFKSRKSSKSLENRIDCFQRDRKEEKIRIETFHWKDIIKKYGTKTKCSLTGKEINLQEPKTYAFDHILPVSRGGNNSIDNLAITTQVVNRAKSDLTNEEFIELCKEVLIHHGYKVSK